ncbi:RICIN domain-containing protein [Candidatus Saccharibacteria bacterium]|nr:RICIN domain-containing protein [Candidatus Saccharibacteria bacterium]
MEAFNRRHPGLIYKITFLFTFISIFTFLTFAHPRESQAASLANFNPGNIISDYTMSNYTTMSVADIDAFLHTHGSCNDTNTIKASWYPSLHYHIEDGHFVCLADEHFAVTGANYGDLLEEDEESQTAAEVIYEVSQKYKINPQVLLVLLEKEQGLISDSWPNSIQFRSATGFGCPDTAPCDSEYYGLKNQLESAAWLFRTVLDGGWTNYPLGENYIHYNPNASCGGSIVYIENLATSSLYRYTPYQPNAAALAAGYGTVTCGAYGNRNFYLFFMDWFGDPTVSKEPIVEAQTKNEQPVEDGWYQIFSKSNPEKVFDIRGGVRNGMAIADMLVFPRNTGTTENQIFKIQFNNDTGYYNIINPTTNLYLDVSGGKTDDGSALIVFPRNNSCNQDWLIEKTNAGYLKFVSRCSSKVLQNTNGVLAINQRSSSNVQEWSLKAVQPADSTIEEGIYQISIGENAFDISGGVSDNMATGKVISFKKNFQDNQLFEAIYNVEEKNYIFKNPASSLVLTSGEVISVEKQDESKCSQKWVLDKRAKGARIKSVCDGANIATSQNLEGEYHTFTTVVPSGVEVTFEPYFSKGNTSLNILAGEYQIRSADSSLALDISGGVRPGMKQGTLILFAARNENIANQTFAIEFSTDKNAYYITNPTSGLRLDVANSGIEDESSVIAFEDNGGYCNQLWSIERSGEEYIISSACSGKPLTLSNKQTGGNYTVEIFTRTALKNQNWKLIKL